MLSPREIRVERDKNGEGKKTSIKTTRTDMAHGKGEEQCNGNQLTDLLRINVVPLDPSGSFRFDVGQVPSFRQPSPDGPTRYMEHYEMGMVGRGSNDG